MFSYWTANLLRRTARLADLESLAARITRTSPPPRWAPSLHQGERFYETNSRSSLSPGCCPGRDGRLRR
jgi:hypothetical protein